METRRDPRKDCILGISEGAAILERSRSPLFPFEAIWHVSQKISTAVPYEEILSGYEEDVSSIQDGFSAWVKTDPETIFRRHVVDARGLSIPLSAKHQPEDMILVLRKVDLTTRCATDCL